MNRESQLATENLEARLAEAPQTWLINFARVVGTIAIAIGLTLLVLTLTAYFS